MSAPILEAVGLHYAYGAGIAGLAGLDLTVRRGRKLALLGPNGAGKTTVLLHLNGSLRPDRGQVRLDGTPIDYDRTGLAAVRRRVGLVVQEPDDQLFAPSVAEDVSFGPLNLGLAETEVRARVLETLAALHIEALADRPPHGLSLGQKKRVAIAGLVAMRPEVLLLDEPMAGLDAHGRAHLLAVLDRLHVGGATVVFTTHDVDLAYAWADEVALLNEGRTLAQGEATAILGDPARLTAARLKPPLAYEIAKALELAATPRDRVALLKALGKGID